MPAPTWIRRLSPVITIFCLLFSAIIHARGTGTLTGEVTALDTGQPLPFANVVLAGTNLGAMTMESGTFTINAIPPGSYTVRATMMGYKPIEKKNIEIKANETASVSFILEVTIVGVTNTIWVYEDQIMVNVHSPRVDKGATGEEVLNKPIDGLEEAVALENGAVKMGDRLYFRGGRADEVIYQIDGVPINDPTNGAATIQIGLLTQSGYSLMSGGMDAEFGNAQSAIVNYSTREGEDSLRGEIRYMTDDFGRADKTYTNYDRLSLGFGGPTGIENLRYYLSGEATFTDTETNTIEPRPETKLTSWLKYRPRLSHSYNLQSKLSWQRGTHKLTAEALFSKSKYDIYLHNWNVDGYVRKNYYFQRLIRNTPGVERYSFAGLTVISHGPWVEKPGSLNPRLVVVEEHVRNPETGRQDIIEHRHYRAVDFGDVTVLWDEAILGPDGQSVSGYKSWVLFGGFQYPYGAFSNFQSDSSYVYFNSASRTPEVDNRNLHLKMAWNYNLSDGLLYTVKLSRLQHNAVSTVNGKKPGQFTSAGLPATLPNGTYLEGGITAACWYTDPDHPYFVTAYDYPVYSNNRTVQYFFKTDLTTTQRSGHKAKTGIQVIYNDLNENQRAFPAQIRSSPATGDREHGLGVNDYHNFNTEGAFYAQDKWEYEGMVLNLGLRFDFFTTGNSNQILVNNSEINPEVENWKYAWSPRMGVAFPISDRDKFFFHYGRITQWPGRSYLFSSQHALGSLGTLGNPNLEPKLTITYQGGISHQFTDHLAANFVVFNKDYYGLISSARVTDDTTGIQSFRYVNRTYASSRGIELSLEKRLTGRIGFDIAYTYSFADGVASDADFGRSAEGLTHLPTDELPLSWDQRHSFNVTLTMVDGNRWGATAVYQYGSGLPWTPYDRFARLQDPAWENSLRLDPAHKLSLQGRKKFAVYGRELTLFFEGKNLLNADMLLPQGTAPQVQPAMIAADMDNGSYLTETGQYGGAYLQDIDDDGINNFVPVNDPAIWENHRSWRIGFGFEF